MKLIQKKEEFEVLQLKDNVIPRGLGPLEELFDFNDVAKNPKMEPIGADIEEYNIGSDQNPKMIKLSKSCLLSQNNNIYSSFQIIHRCPCLEL